MGTATLRADRFAVRQLVLADQYLSFETVHPFPGLRR